MTEQGKYFIEEYKKGNVLVESMQTLYEKGHISKDEFIEVVGKEPQEKQIDICTPKTNQELQEEIENLKTQLEVVHERLCTQQEMSATVIASVFGREVLKNE